MRNVLYPPVIVSQLTGTFPFSLSPNADISFCWFGWPFLVAVGKLTFTLLAFLLFISNSEEYTSLFGGWGGIDLATSMMVVITGFIADLFIFLMTIKDHREIQNIQSNFASFVVNLLSEAESDIYLHNHLEILKKRGTWLKTRVKIVVILTIMNYIITASTGIFYGIYLNKPIWITLSSSLVAYCMQGVNIIRQVQVLVLSGFLLWIWFGLRILRFQLLGQLGSGSDRDLERVLHKWKSIIDLIEEFNVKFQWQLACGTFVSLISVLTSFYQFGSWLVAVGLMSTVGTLPAILSSIFVVCSVTRVASDIQSEGKLFIEVLRDVDGCKWVRRNVALNRRIRLCHISGALQSPKIRPGHFFTLGRCFIPSVGNISFF